MKLFDSHAHLTDERFAGDVETVLVRARDAGVSRLVTIASDVDDAEAALALASAHDGLWCTAGIHPHAAHSATPEALARVREITDRPEVVAIGETGLDYYYENAPRETQRLAFAAQLALGAETGLPVVVHAREADADAVAIVGDAGPDTRGVLHCFASGASLLQAGLDAGWHVSFSGLVSFKNYDGRDLVRAVPDDRLLVETDSPYLAPVPRRGKRNEPAFVRHVVEALAAIRDQTPEQVAAFTFDNAVRFYGLGA